MTLLPPKTYRYQVCILNNIVTPGNKQKYLENFMLHLQTCLIVPIHLQLLKKLFQSHNTLAMLTIQ